MKRRKERKRTERLKTIVESLHEMISHVPVTTVALMVTVVDWTFSLQQY